MSAQKNKEAPQVINSFTQIISKDKVEEAFKGFSRRERVYHGWALFQLYLHQSTTGGSCRETVAWGIGRGIIPSWASPHTSAYCLKCKTPARCRSELYMGLTAYNIVRGVMLDAARKAGLPARRISFRGTMQRLKNYFTPLLFKGDPERTYELLLKHLSLDKVVERPGRWEPRKRKRRPKNYGYLTEPRKSFIHATLSA